MSEGEVILLSPDRRAALLSSNDSRAWPAEGVAGSGFGWALGGIVSCYLDRHRLLAR